MQVITIEGSDKRVIEMTEGRPSFGVNAKRKPMSALVLCQFTVQFSYHFGPRFHTMDARPSENVTERPIWPYICFIQCYCSVLLWLWSCLNRISVPLSYIICWVLRLTEMIGQARRSSQI